ncbi:MAG TPA: amidase domain-containing protein [Candidatus Saccharimonadales bacterium]
MPESPTHLTLTETHIQPLEFVPETYEVGMDVADQAVEEQSMSLRDRFYRSRIGRLAMGGLAALGLAAGGVAVEASPAIAASNPVYTVTNHDNDGTNGIYYRNSPRMADTIRQLPYYARYGDRIELICGTNGEAVGQYNNRRWHLVRDLDNPKAPNQFYIPDHDTNTPNKANRPTVGERECGSAGSQPQGHEANPQFKGQYDRDRAVHWAEANAQMQPPAYGSCTWFASNVLWQGGLPRTREWTSEGYLGNRIKTTLLGGKLPGTLAAWNPNALKDYLLKTYPNSQFESLNFQANKVPDAMPGDLIFYDWGKGENISHVAVVVNIAPGQYPQVAEWSPGDDTSQPAPYPMRGWTRSQISHKWLQDKYPHVRAYLLHIDTANMRLKP